MLPANPAGHPRSTGIEAARAQVAALRGRNEAGPDIGQTMRAKISRQDTLLTIIGGTKADVVMTRMNMNINPITDTVLGLAMIGQVEITGIDINNDKYGSCYMHIFVIFCN